MDKKSKTATDNQWTTPESANDAGKELKAHKSATDNEWVSTNKK